jgi:hypothetical protein
LSNQAGFVFEPFWLLGINDTQMTKIRIAIQKSGRLNEDSLQKN